MYKVIARYTKKINIGYTVKRFFAYKDNTLYELHIAYDEANVEAFRYLRRYRYLTEQDVYQYIVILTRDY